MLESVGFWHVAAVNALGLAGVWGVLRESQRRDAVRVRLAQIRQAQRELQAMDGPVPPRPTMAAPIIEGEIVSTLGARGGTGAGSRPTVADLPGVTTLGQVLATGWRPSVQAILMAQGRGGALLTVPLRKLVHVLMIGPTGVGKSNIARSVFSQIETLDGIQTEWWNPHYMPIDHETGEEWWQMAAATTRGAALTQVDAIMAALETLACEELPARKARGAAGHPVGPPCFYLVDEVPVLSADRRFAEWIGVILREGRKYGLFVMMASQDVQIKTIGGSVGMRANAQTVFYGGGDKVSAHSLFGFTPPDPPGQGVIYLKSQATPDVPLVRVPLVENADLNTLLGPVIGYQDGYQPATPAPMPPAPVVATGKPNVATVAVSEAAIEAYLAFLGGDDSAKITRARTGIDSSKGGAYQRANEETQQLIRDGARAFLAQRMEG